MSRLLLFVFAFAVGLTVSRATDVEVQASNSKLPFYRPALVAHLR